MHVFRCNRWKKRGLAVIPTKYGVAFGLILLNQGGALLHVYTDGSVLLTHGGMEMGQGLHTKMVQVCARCLGVPPERVHISETCTNTVPNASPTAASSSSDLYGMAVKVREEWGGGGGQGRRKRGGGKGRGRREGREEGREGGEQPVLLARNNVTSIPSIFPYL